jgi:hypothetical protein
MKTRKQKITLYTILFLFLCALIFVGQYLYNQSQKADISFDELPESTDQDEGESNLNE